MFWFLFYVLVLPVLFSCCLDRRGKRSLLFFKNKQRRGMRGAYFNKQRANA